MNTNTSIHPSRPQAFALAELLIAVGIAALLAMALSLAVVGAGRRTAVAADELFDARRAREALHAAIGEIRFADHIVNLDPDSLTFTLPDASGTASTPPIRYYHYPDDNQLRRSCAEQNRLLLERVYGLTFTAGETSFNSNGDVCLHTLTVAIQYASEPEATSKTTIHLVNRPIW